MESANGRKYRKKDQTTNAWDCKSSTLRVQNVVIFIIIFFLLLLLLLLLLLYNIVIIIIILWL